MVKLSTIHNSKDMRKKYILGILAVASLGFTACSDDEISEEIINPTPEEEVQHESAVSELGVFKFQSELGTLNGSSIESRSPNDVDGSLYPTDKYGLDYVYMMSLTPEKQPTAENSGEEIPVYKKEFQIRQDKFKNGIYKLYYKLEGITSNKDKNVSNSGKILLANNKEMKNPIEFNLSLFDLGKLEKGRIGLNEFPFGQIKDKELKGSTLRYTSYNPIDLPRSKNIATLPVIEDDELSFMKGKDTHNNTLVGECKDEYFVGNEFLIAADDEKIYMLEVVPVKGEYGGYFVIRTYDTKKSSEANPDYLALRRLTSIVNASFAFIDEETKSSSTYYVENNEEATKAKFESVYGASLDGLKCRFAAIDGVNRNYYINNPKGWTEDLSRLVLWADSKKSNNHDTRNGKPSMTVKISNIQHDHSDAYGILGNSFSVIFPGKDTDTRGQKVMFWVELGNGVRIKISVPMGINTGVPFLQNTTQDLIVLVPAQKFADTVKEYEKDIAPRALMSRFNNDNDYAELCLTPDCLVIK